MAGDWLSRCLLSGLHVCAGIAACGSLVAVLLQWAQHLDCLAPVTDGFGDSLSVKTALGIACNVITYSSGIMCALNFLMAVSLHCCSRTWCCSFLHQLLTVLMCLLSAGSGATLTVDFLLWCHSLPNSLGGYTGCEAAARAYDNKHKTSNMTAYFRKMEMQQVCEWAVVPFLLCAIFVYSVVMKKDAQPVGVITREIGGRYYILYDDESSPLIPASLPSAPSSTNPGRGANNAAEQATASG